MKTGPTYVVPFRRRGEFVTNYRKRLAALKSRLPRLVVRKSTRSVVVQLVAFEPAADRVIAGVHSNELKGYGWSPRANIPTAYLAGLLCAMKAKKAKLKDMRAILDVGLATTTKGSFAFAALKGALDGGLDVAHSCEFDESRIGGAHITGYAAKLKKKSEEAYRRQFGAYVKAGIDPEKLGILFDSAKERILKG